jgi:hypothetical protein
LYVLTNFEVFLTILELLRQPAKSIPEPVITHEANPQTDAIGYSLDPGIASFASHILIGERLVWARR